MKINLEAMLSAAIKRYLIIRFESVIPLNASDIVIAIQPTSTNCASRPIHCHIISWRTSSESLPINFRSRVFTIYSSFSVGLGGCDFMTIIVHEYLRYYAYILLVAQCINRIELGCLVSWVVSEEYTDCH